MLQRSGKPIVLAVNKMDSTGNVDPDFYEFYNLGLGDPIAVSAVHGHGTGDLLDECVKYFPPEGEDEEDDDRIQVASSTLDFFRIPAVSMKTYFPVSFSK